MSDTAQVAGTGTIHDMTSRQSRGGTAVGAPDKPKVGQVANFDNPRVRAEIDKAFKQLKSYEDQRSELNSKMGAIRKNLQAKGLNSHSLRYMYSVWKLEEPKREKFAETMKVIDKSLQMGLFEEVEAAAEQPKQ